MLQLKNRGNFLNNYLNPAMQAEMVHYLVVTILQLQKDRLIIRSLILKVRFKLPLILSQ